MEKNVAAALSVAKKVWCVCVASVLCVVWCRVVRWYLLVCVCFFVVVVVVLWWCLSLVVWCCCMSVVEWQRRQVVTHELLNSFIDRNTVSAQTGQIGQCQKQELATLYSGLHWPSRLRLPVLWFTAVPPTSS